MLIEDWRIDYNINRSHSAHGWLKVLASFSRSKVLVFCGQPGYSCHLTRYVPLGLLSMLAMPLPEKMFCTPSLSSISPQSPQSVLRSEDSGGHLRSMSGTKGEGVFPVQMPC